MWTLIGGALCVSLCHDRSSPQQICKIFALDLSHDRSASNFPLFHWMHFKQLLQLWQLTEHKVANTIKCKLKATHPSHCSTGNKISETNIWRWRWRWRKLPGHEIIISVAAFLKEAPCPPWPFGMSRVNLFFPWSCLLMMMRRTLLIVKVWLNCDDFVLQWWGENMRKVKLEN